MSQRRNGVDVRWLKTKSWVASVGLHLVAGLVAVVVAVPRIERDYITVSTAAEPLELEVAVDFSADPQAELQRLIDDAPAYREVLVEPPKVVLDKPTDQLTVEDIRELVRLSVEQAADQPLEKQVDALQWLLEVDSTVVSDESAQEITDKVKEALGYEERQFEPQRMAKINELDNDTVVPYYRITEQPSPIVQVIDINPNGDYRIFQEKPVFELYDVEMAEYRQYLDEFPTNQDELLQELMKRENPQFNSTPQTVRHFRTISRPPGRYFQVISVDAEGRYRIMTEKPESQMTFLEWARLRAFQLTEHPRHKKYREAVLGAADSGVADP